MPFIAVFFLPEKYLKSADLDVPISDVQVNFDVVPLCAKLWKTQMDHVPIALTEKNMK